MGRLLGATGEDQPLSRESPSGLDRFGAGSPVGQHPSPLRTSPMSSRRRLGQRETQEGLSVRAREPNDGAALAEGAEADAIAIQARLALSGAADRAATLGAHDHAVNVAGISSARSE